jgi:hypothetical protein
MGAKYTNKSGTMGLLKVECIKSSYFVFLILYMNVIITGASKGIGKAISRTVCCTGASKGITHCFLFICSRNEKQLYDAVADCKQNIPVAQ